MTIEKAAEDRTPVERELGALSVALTLLNDTIANHAVKLDPILYPEDPKEKEPTDESKVSSPLVAALSDKRWKLLRSIDALQDLTKRLEI